jgi:hypothetical protein
MPHDWNNMLVVTEKELIPIFYKSIYSLCTVINRAEKRGYGIKRVQHGGGKNRVMLIDFDSLPTEIREELGDPRKVGHILERYYRTDKDVIDFYSSEFIFPDGSYIDDQIQEQYITNACLLKALVKLRDDRVREIISKGGVVKKIYESLLNDAISFKPILKKQWHVEHTIPESERRFRETFNDFINYGPISLISGKHKNANARKVDDDIITLLNNMFSGQNHKPTYAEVASQYEGFLDGYVEVINNKTAEIYDPKGYRQIGEGIIKKYLAKWENKIGNEAKRSGDRQKLIQKFEPWHSLDHPEFAGSIISIDDRQPPFKYEKDKRVWFYNAIDLGSEAITCWVYGKTKEGIILDFYRQLVRNYHTWGLNLPSELECESSLNSSFANTFLKEGNMFENVRIEANKARGKRIEGYFRPLRYGLEKKREGWISRPFSKSEANQEGSAPVPLIPYNDIITGCLKDIETWNNMPCSIYPEKTRWEIFLEKQHPNLKPTNYRRILPYLGYKTETSCHAGIINLQSKKFLLGDNGIIYSGEKLITLMKAVEGQNIDIYWLDDNDGNVFKALIYIGTQYICEALPKPSYNRAKIEQTPQGLENREIMSKYAATIYGYMNSQKKNLNEVTVIDNRPVTLNNKFSIFGNKTVKIDEAEVEIMPESQEDEFDLMPIENSYKSSLKERF